MANEHDKIAFHEFVVKGIGDFRLLLIVVALAAAIGGCEYSRRAQVVDLYLADPVNFTDVLAAVYPDDPGVQNLKARQLTQCLAAMRSGRTLPSPCQQYADVDPVRTAREFYERGIASSKHIEDLYFDYAVFLMFTSSDQAAIDAAFESWRRNFPLSNRPDPRLQ